MAIAITVTPPSMNAGQYERIIRRLEDAGAGAPSGRTFHVAFGTGNSLRVVDVWDSREQFDAFGQTLLPILQDVGVDMGEVETFPLHNQIVATTT